MMHKTAGILAAALLFSNVAMADDLAVVLLVDETHQQELSGALEVELSAASLQVSVAAAPQGATPIMRAAAAQQAARDAGAEFALWVEPAFPESLPAGSVRAVSSEGGEVRDAPLPQALGEVSARVFAVVAATLLSEQPREVQVIEQAAPAAEPTDAQNSPASESTGSEAAQAQDAPAPGSAREAGTAQGYARLDIRSPNVYGVLRLNGETLKGWTPRMVRRVPAGTVEVEVLVDGVVRRHRTLRLQADEDRTLVLW